ncbi:MAG TPA: hypothetical protein VIG62_24470 [Blastocatellia bacterium]|jgi:hypothetical protein
MKGTTYEGVVENGKVRLPENIRLPEKAKVYVVVPDAESQPIAYIGSPRLLHSEQAGDFKKEVIEEINDAGI